MHIEKFNNSWLLNVIKQKLAKKSFIKKMFLVLRFKNDLSDLNCKFHYRKFHLSCDK